MRVNINMPNEAIEIIWWVGSAYVLFTLLGGLLMLSSDTESKEAGKKLLVGWWGGATSLIAAVLAMTFIVKPVLVWVFSLF